MVETTIAQPTTHNKLRVWLMLSLFVLVVLGISGYAWAKKTVTIDHEGKVTQVATFDGSVQEVLKQAGINIGPHDVVTPAVQTKLKEGLKIKIEKAFPVGIEADGKVVEVWTVGGKVQEILEKAKIAYNTVDKVNPSLASNVSKGLSIKVTRVSEKVEHIQFPVPYKTEKRRDKNITFGITKVIQEGQSGLAKKVVKIIYENGKVVKREVVQNGLIKQPVPRIVAVGTLRVVSRGGKDLRYDRSMVMNASGYTHTGNRTATGLRPYRGVVAVDPSVISFGTRLYVDGYGYALAADRGSAIRGSKIDLFFETNSEAVRWGRRNVRVYIIED